jgi:hypothetical protein
MPNCKSCGNVSTESRPDKTRIGASRSETLANSLRCCGHWRTWPPRNGRCLSWTIARDQVMTICKVALVNLVMWTRDHYFPLSYAHATWKRLAPFFHLPGLVTRGPRAVSVELRPFNDHQLNHDLVALCEGVNQAAPQLPDGRQLLFSVCPFSDQQRRRQDCAPASASG